jgi:hypothetical protein
MKRTTIYLAPELEMRLKRETVRRGQPMAELVREAVEAYLSGDEAGGPPGGGDFASGHRDTAERAEHLFGELGFGDSKAPAVEKPYPRTRRPRPRKRA